jgi:hypothetical protein
MRGYFGTTAIAGSAMTSLRFAGASQCSRQRGLSAGRSTVTEEIESKPSSSKWTTYQASRAKASNIVLGFTRMRPIIANSEGT